MRDNRSRFTDHESRITHHESRITNHQSFLQMQNLKITLQYDGTDYHGWQIQANGRTVQGELTRVLSLLDHRPVTVHGAGRTDAGVHAEGQVANFLAQREFEPHLLRDAINANLDRDVRVLRVEPAPEQFNARFAARRKIYRYRIWTTEVVSPFVYRYVYQYRAPLDLEKMERSAEALTGVHDFSAFTVADSEVEDRVRTLTELNIRRETNEIMIEVVANGFLRYMVRTIVGTLIDVGRGQRTAESVGEALASRERPRAGAAAPACGLTLVRVDY
jgi:tRNA pseudouridine38-40 synthase